MLKALWRWLWPKEAEPTQKGRKQDYVTPEQLELAIEESTKELQYEWNEWYEKFNTLHLRLSKREKRNRNSNPVEQEQREEETPPSVLTFRRLGSP